MTVLEQNKIKEKYYNESIRYIENAKEILKKANKEGKYYQDEKYVKIASGTAYLAVLLALDCLLLLKNIPLPRKNKRQRADINYYFSNLATIDKKVLKTLKAAYDTLHLSGYYDGNPKVDIIQSGFEDAMTIINKIKPSNLNNNGYLKSE